MKNDKSKMVKSILFVPLAKVDEANRTVTGVATAQVLDKAGETFHYESSVPYFKSWSDNISKVTKGKSKGNVRAMHQPVAVGKLTDILFDDEAKEISVTAKIVDDAEWEKVEEGVYTGFSIGGKYIKQWDEDVDGEEFNFFTADPVEISIVDNPCVPTAHFKMAKADGSEVNVEFKLYEPSNDEIAAKAAEIAEEEGEGSTWTDFIDKATEALKAEHGLPEAHELEKVDEEDDSGEEEEDEDDTKKKAKKVEDEEEEEEDAEKADPLNLVKQQWVATDGKSFDKKADCVEYQASLDDPVKAALAKAKKAISGDDEEQGDLFPVDTEFRIRSSWVLANKATFETEEAKAETLETIRKAWEEKIGTEPPSAELIEQFTAEKVTDAMDKVAGGKLEKGLYRVREWASAIESVTWATECLSWYDSDEESSMHEEAKAICATLLTFLIELVQHDAGLQLANLDKMDKEVDTPLAKMIVNAIESAPVDDVEKAATSDLRKQLEAEKLRSDKLEKQVSDAVEGISALTKEIKDLKDQPEPRRHLSGKTVEKSADRTGKEAETPATQDDLKRLVEEHGPEKVSAMLIKISQSAPKKMLD